MAHSQVRRMAFNMCGACLSNVTYSEQSQILIIKWVKNEIPKTWVAADHAAGIQCSIVVVVQGTTEMDTLCSSPFRA